MDSAHKKRTMTSQRNPLLFNTVVNCIFKYLPLEDLKQCRFVCHEWNSASVKILNKQSEIKLDSNERMTSFLEFFKGYDTRSFPFTSFHFKFSNNKWITEEYENVIASFDTLREGITNLRFHGLKLSNRINLTPLIDVAINLVSLTLSSCNSVIELKTLAKVKNIYFYYCCVSLDSFENRIAPLSISLSEVYFERKDNAMQEIIINDYIDFSGCSEIKIISPYSIKLSMAFDMRRDIISARKVEFRDIRVINSKATPSKENKRMLSLEKHKSEVGVEIKQLKFSDSEVNLSVLPKSIEKLTLEYNTYSTVNCVSIDLPNLKCLIFRPMVNDITDDMSPSDYDMGIITSMFRLCPKLVDIELNGWLDCGWKCDIHVDLMPVTLKRIKLTNHQSINFVGDTVIEVDILILSKGTFADAQKFMTKIKPKILLVQFKWEDVEDPANVMASFIEESRNLEKILIKISYERTLSNYFKEDDEESDCYKFTNQVVKHLTADEFNIYCF